MKRLTCEQVQPLLDLYAAGACDPADRRAIRHHLGDCPRCQDTLAESRALVGLLDLHYRQEQGLVRLRETLQREPAARRPRPRRSGPAAGYGWSTAGSRAPV